MPIRLNLLAEAQALEDMRRRDPVKRAIWFGVIVGLIIIGWSSTLQLKAMIAKSELSNLTSTLSAKTNEAMQVRENQRKLEEVNFKLVELRRLTTNRFLNGNMLDALQHSTVDDVHLMRLKTDHNYTLVEETKPKTNASGGIIKGRPATVTEKIVLTLDAKDASLQPGDQVNKYKEAIAANAYFQRWLGRTNEVKLIDYGTLQPATADSKPFIPFKLECRFPEKTR
jgi:hypothetical protein